MTNLILPQMNGVPNLEIRRVQRELETERAQQRGVHPQTANEISKELDKIRELADQGAIRALAIVALLRPTREMPELSEKLHLAVDANAKVLFACPATDRPMAEDLAATTQAFIEHVMRVSFPPPTKA